jgi:hypothetical protein
MAIVSDNYFLPEDPAPAGPAIASALGGALPWYESILASAEGFEREWKHYGKKYGWKLKAHDGRKALFELTIGTAGLRVSIAVRESEMIVLREDFAPVLDLLQPPGKSKEGWGIRLPIIDQASCDRAKALIGAVAKIRRED